MVLYRKYRPKSFSEVTGQEHIVQTLKSALLNDLLSHAYLFSGPRGSGKTTMARLLAKAVNCPSTTLGTHKLPGEPCNRCEFCEEINAGRAIDVIELDAASNRGIDEMRQLKEGIIFSPVKLATKVFIIDEAHQLTKEAANALLKTLEEPPSHAMFILATTEPHKMIPTIASRCQRFDFRKLRVLEIVSKLQEIAKAEDAEITKEALELLALNSGGALRDAIGLLDKVLTFHSLLDREKDIGVEEVKDLLGLVDLNLVAAFVQFLVDKKPGEAIDFLNSNLQQGLDPQEFAKNVVRYLRHTFVLKINPELAKILDRELTGEQIERMKKQGALMEESALARIVENFMEAEQQMKYSSIIQLPLELAIVESCGIDLPREQTEE